MAETSIRFLRVAIVMSTGCFEKSLNLREAWKRIERR